MAARYPERAQRIMQLYWRSSTFREICGDYQTVVAALIEVRHRSSMDAASESALLDLLADLEGELEEHLREEHPTPDQNAIEQRSDLP